MRSLGDIQNESVLFEYLVVVFFFKQKTAYEMRISDWSSDVCSSDPHMGRAQPHRRLEVIRHAHRKAGDAVVLRQLGKQRKIGRGLNVGWRHRHQPGNGQSSSTRRRQQDRQIAHRAAVFLRLRSEEHTSELQSLMRISYAVFCLTTKNNKTTVA